jgi:hypothetical protein
MQINLGCLCNIACAIISISFLTMCDSALEMFFCVSIGTFYLRDTIEKLRKLNKVKEE